MSTVQCLCCFVYVLLNPCVIKIESIMHKFLNSYVGLSLIKILFLFINFTPCYSLSKALKRFFLKKLKDSSEKVGRHGNNADSLFMFLSCAGTYSAVYLPFHFLPSSLWKFHVHPLRRKVSAAIELSVK